MGYEIIEVDGINISSTTKRFPVEIVSEAHAINGVQHTGILDDNQIPIGIMRVNAHQLDPHTMLIDGRDVSSDGSKLDTVEIGAQVNNITDAQAADLTNGGQCNWHTHDSSYYTKTQLQTSGSAIVDWGNLTNIPSTFAPSLHNHNDIYFTQSQLTSGQLDSRYYTESEVDVLVHGASIGVQGAVDTFANLPTPDVAGIIYIVRQTVDTNEEGFYRWDGTKWIFLANNTGIETHNQLSGLNNGDYKHLTTSEYAGLTSGVSTNLHLHDDRYYTETEVDTKLATKSDISHNHNDSYYTKALIDAGQLDSRYYTETELQTSGSASVAWGNLTSVPTTFTPSDHNHDSRYYTQDQLINGQLDSRYYTEAEVDVKLTSKSDSSHTHDDRYYTETEVDTKLATKSDSSHTHDDRYYTETELKTSGSASVAWGNLTSVPATFTPSDHNHDSRYYTEDEIDSALATKAALVHVHDDRYYTETELQTSGSASIHWDNITNKPTFSGNNWLEPVLIRYAGTSLPTSGYSSGARILLTSDNKIYQYDGSVWNAYSPSANDTIMVSNDGDSKPAQYWYNGTSWVKIADPDYSDHGSLSGLSDDDHPQYLTVARHSAITTNPHSTTISQVIAADSSLTWGLTQLNNLFNSSDFSLHNHDSMYYTKEQSNANFASISHTHSDYYTKSQVDTLISSITYATISANDPNTDVTASELEQLTNGSNCDGLHTHSNSGSGSSATLDSAYGTYGNGRSITVDHGPVELNATDGFAPLRITPISYTPNQWLSSGQICFKDAEPYFYDATRSLWMSFSELNFVAGSNNTSASGYLYPVKDVVFNSTLGWCMPFDGVVVGLSLSNANSNATAELQVLNSGTFITSFWFSGFSSSIMSLNANFSANDVLELYINGYGNQRPNKPIATLFVRKRI